MLKPSKFLLISLGLASFFPFVTYAAAPETHEVIAPVCLLNSISTSYATLAQNKQVKLVRINQAGMNKIIAAKHQTANCGGFFEVSQAWSDYAAKNQPAAFLANYVAPAKKSSLAGQKASYSVNYPTQVNQLITQMNPQAMWNDLTKLTSFTDRYADSDNGVQAAAWIKSQIEAMAAGRNDVTINYVSTGRYKQPSLVVKVGNSSEPGIVIGGHMDTLFTFFDTKPGADDDGTGSVTVLEVARTVLNSGMHFKKPIYFIWYSAEEMGLVGSQYVVKDFKNKNIPVADVIHFDMTGYVNHGDLTMWLMDDYVDKNLTSYLETLINTYVKRPVKHSTCGYACSDHATWTQNGFTAAVPFETEMGSDNPAIHTAQDTMEKLSLEHMTDYAKLGIAFAVELAEPVS